MVQSSVFAMNASSDARSAAFSVRHAVSFGALPMNELYQRRIDSIPIPFSARPSISDFGTGTLGGTPCRRANFSSREMTIHSPASLMALMLR